MTIGEALKKEQEKLGITEEKMAAHIISKSAYSRIINDKRRISSDLLIEILLFHNIDLETFFSEIEDTYASKRIKLEKQLSEEMGLAINNHETAKAKQCLEKIEKSEVNEYLKKRAKIATHALNRDLKSLDQSFKNEIMNDLNQNDNWVFNVNALRLFGLAMSILSVENVENEIDFLLTKINKNFSLSDTMKERYATIICNYLHWKYDHTKNKEKTLDRNITRAINYLKNLKSSAHNIMYIISAQYYTALFTNDIKRAKKIKEELIDVGCNLVVKNWPV